MIFSIKKQDGTLIDLFIEEEVFKVSIPQEVDVKSYQEILKQKTVELQSILCNNLVKVTLEKAEVVNQTITQEMMDDIVKFLFYDINIQTQFETVIVSEDVEYPLNTLQDFLNGKKILLLNDTIYDKETLKEIDYQLKIKTKVFLEGVIKPTETMEKIIVEER